MAIVRPEEMDFSGKRFSMIISGSPGVGKTTLALSAPNPVLIDFDKGISRVKAAHRKTTLMCATYEEVLQDLKSDVVKNAETLVIDTGGSFITFLQDWAIRDNPKLNAQKNGAISLKGFGAVKSEFVRFTNSLLYTQNKNVIYIFHTVESKDGDITKQRLMCEGAARNIVWQPCDLGCFVQIIDGERYAGFSPTESYFAKGCYGISGLLKIPVLSEGEPNRFLTDLFAMARKNIAEENKVFEMDKAKYNAAMEEAHEIVRELDGIEEIKTTTERLKQIDHALTSEREAKALLAERLKELGIRWDKERKEYVVSD